MTLRAVDGGGERCAGRAWLRLASVGGRSMTMDTHLTAIRVRDGERVDFAETVRGVYAGEVSAEEFSVAVVGADEEMPAGGGVE